MFLVNFCIKYCVSPSNLGYSISSLHSFKGFIYNSMSPFPAENMIKHESWRELMVRENDIQILIFLAFFF